VVKKIKTCVFISGSGTNLRCLIKNSRDYNSPIKINLIISNNKNANGLKFARKYNIPYKIFVNKSRIIFEKNCLLELKERKIKFICLAGFMKVLSKNFIANFKYKIFNMHPSLLPKFKGLNTHTRVLNSGEKFTGCTVHLVTSKLDSGKIILQKKISVHNNDTEKTLRERVLKQEHKLYTKAIRYAFG